MGGAVKAITKAVTAPFEATNDVIKGAAHGDIGGGFKDGFDSLKSDAKDVANATAKDGTRVTKAVVHVAAELHEAQTKLHAKPLEGLGNVVGGSLGDESVRFSHRLNDDAAQLADAARDAADSQARLAEEEKFFDVKAQKAEAKRINETWVKDRVVYDEYGNPHIIRGIGGKAATAMSIVAAVFPPLYLVAVAANAANAANNGNMKGALIAVAASLVPGASNAIASAVGAGESIVAKTLVDMAVRGTFQGVAAQAQGGEFGDGFVAGAAAGAANGAVAEINPQIASLPPGVQTAIREGIRTAIINGAQGKPVDLNAVVLGGLANYAATQAGQQAGLNAKTTEAMAAMITTAVRGGGNAQILAGAATTAGAALYGDDPKMAKAFGAMVNGSVALAKSNPGANQALIAVNMLASAAPLLPKDQIKTDKPMDPTATFTAGSQAPEIGARPIGIRG